MESTDQRWKDFYARLEGQPHDNTSHKVFAEAMRPQNYGAQSRLITERFPNLKGMSVLEIGCGFGGLCWAIHQIVVPQSYTVIDNPKMLEFAQERLKKQKGIAYIMAPHIDMIDWSGRQYDLLISNYCISETPREYQDYVFKKVFPRCDNVFMLDGDKKSDYPERLQATLDANFRTVVKNAPYELDWRVDVWVARHKKGEAK